jgi:hypothetical protein
VEKHLKIGQMKGQSQGLMNQEQSPNKKDWEGGPGKLSKVEVTKYCRINLHKA